MSVNPLLLIALFAPVLVRAQSTLPGFDDFMAKAMAEFKAPGVAVAIVKDGKIILAKGYGYADVQNKRPITTATRFPIASITKSFTVTALGTLVDQGRLDWDKPVRTYMPEFRMYDPVATEQLTTRDMVTHRSGLPRHDLTWYSSSFSRDELVRRLRYLEPNKPIREKFQYNNLMFLTAGFLGGRIAGTSWEEIVRRGVLQPLGMRQTTFTSEEARKAPDHALPYRRNRKTDETRAIEFSHWGDVGPAGSMNSSIEDMSRYLLMHVNKGSFEGKQVLGRNNSEQMQSPQMVIQGTPLFSELSENSYGMGLFINSYRGHKHVSHGGNLDGFSLQLSFLPNDNIGVVVLTNLDGTPLRDLVPLHVYDVLLGLKEVDWVKRFRDIETKAQAQEKEADKRGLTGTRGGTHVSHALSDYTGEFDHPGYGKIAVRTDGGKLWMKLNDVERPLEHLHYDTFQVPANPLDSFEKFRITFPADDRGEISTVRAVLESSVKEIYFSRVPEKRMFESSFLRQLAGEYDTPGRPTTVALAGENALQMVSPGAPPRKLIPLRGTRFAMEGVTGVTLEFKQDASGRATEMVVDAMGDMAVVPRKN